MRYFELLTLFCKRATEANSDNKKIDVIFKDQGDIVYGEINLGGIPLFIFRKFRVSETADHTEEVAMELLKMVFVSGVHLEFDHKEKLSKALIQMKNAPLELMQKQLQVVPFQVCPVCNGFGNLPAVLSTTAFQKCHVCEGACVIPMCIVK